MLCIPIYTNCCGGGSSNVFFKCGSFLIRCQCMCRSRAWSTLAKVLKYVQAQTQCYNQVNALSIKWSTKNGLDVSTNANTFSPTLYICITIMVHATDTAQIFIATKNGHI